MTPASSANGSRSNSITELKFDLSNSSYFFVGLSAVEDCRVQLRKKFRLNDGTLVEFFTANACDTEQIYTRANQSTMIDSVRVLADSEPGVTFRAEVSGQCIVETIEQTGAIPGAVRATNGTGRVITQVPRDVEPSAVIDAVSEHHPTAELLARHPLDGSAPVFTAKNVQQAMCQELTDRQWEVLQTAFKHGYFDRPRECTGEEIADKLDIAGATFSQHLRAAVRNLLSMAIDERGDAE